ncbi:hypothetical protein DFA_08683 [Cavenderia fasciculata]|uniref:Uncharacterized protein n=1 Tax=Cavenderia fasciculata TaxID=261658 RepID=F4Q3M9_CACFS|nr:uncharacterized protein DFA_08683 [Cavenderia fasciculata]EGG17687.1 hypothetical protein DFA_08683 [Cavenderia fasciculata]|eukprot:XP_004356171.1 hypothetical protein DFA_08683 [Cavenderia fasciculata]
MQDVIKQKVPLRRLLKMSSPEIHLFIMGCIAALCTGSVNPIFSILLAEILIVFQNPEMDTLKKEAAMMGHLVLGRCGIALIILMYHPIGCPIQMSHSHSVAQNLYQGSWIRHSNNVQPCNAPVYTNMTVPGKSGPGGTFSTHDSESPSYTYLVNCTFNADNTFTGQGSIYYPNSWKLYGYVQVKGQFLSNFNFVVVYPPYARFNYQGSTQYYALDTCNYGFDDQEDLDFENVPRS